MNITVPQTEEYADITKLVIDGEMDVLTRKLMRFPHLCHQQNEYGDFIAHTACRFGRSEVVMLLGRLEYDFDSEYNSMGYLPIHTACQYRQIDCVLALQLCGADIGAPTESDKLTSMHIACRLGYIPLVHALVRAGVKFNTPDAYGNTPLSTAVALGYTSITDIARSQMDFTEQANQCIRNLLK
ncbi:hypothetical protein CRM22_006615 [Opisthorchis felineus]|uniref:Uncharacterized protein n=1 Tax=Opisthorchis felineus TaxID=147828 RepID=A0A4S2LLT2_OPIFE|nr:hypothetical protein CRM22_006615 [Opisthorchis felineus]